MLNINYPHNFELMKKCRRLHDYSYFINAIAKNQKAGYNKKVAISLAMDECIENDILADILQKQKSEVLRMLLTEFDEKKYAKLFFRDGKEEGLAEGLATGLETGRMEGQTAVLHAISLIRQGCDTEKELIQKGVDPKVAKAAIETMFCEIKS